MSKLQQLLSSVLLLLFLSNSVFASSIVSDKDSLLFAAIVQQDLESLNELLITPGDINRKYGDNQQTLLTFAIEKGKAEASKFLVSKGADIEAKYDRKTPLMFAARYGWEEIAVMLIESGADINSTNRERNTAFHYAAKYNNLDLLKTLFSEGAKINIPNKDSWTALDYSIIGGKKETEEYLRSIGCVLFKKEIPNYFDGPYIELTERSTALINYLANVNGKKGSYIDSEEVKIERGKLEFKGRKPDKNQYLISTDPTPPPSMYEEPPRIFAIGDIHGQYERMVEMLRAGGVIDKQNNWSW
jgi:ankyrin repeat protein